MRDHPDRRTLLKAAAATAGLGLGGLDALAAQLKLGPEQSFSFDTLKQMARERAARPYAPPPRLADDIASGQQRGNGRHLNGRGGLIAEVSDRCEHRPGDAELLE